MKRLISLTLILALMSSSPSAIPIPSHVLAPSSEISASLRDVLRQADQVEAQIDELEPAPEAVLKELDETIPKLEEARIDYRIIDKQIHFFYCLEHKKGFLGFFQNIFYLVISQIKTWKLKKRIKTSLARSEFLYHETNKILHDLNNIFFRNGQRDPGIHHVDQSLNAILFEDPSLTRYCQDYIFQNLVPIFTQRITIEIEREKNKKSVEEVLADIRQDLAKLWANPDCHDLWKKMQCYDPQTGLTIYLREASNVFRRSLQLLIYIRFKKIEQKIIEIQRSFKKNYYQLVVSSKKDPPNEFLTSHHKNDFYYFPIFRLLWPGLKENSLLQKLFGKKTFLEVEEGLALDLTEQLKITEKFYDAYILENILLWLAKIRPDLRGQLAPYILTCAWKPVRKEAYRDGESLIYEEWRMKELMREFVNSLTPEQLNQLRSIPGILSIIETIKDSPEKFYQRKLYRSVEEEGESIPRYDDEGYPNPADLKIRSGLAEIALHFLEKDPAVKPQTYFFDLLWHLLSDTTTDSSFYQKLGKNLGNLSSEYLMEKILKLMSARAAPGKTEMYQFTQSLLEGFEQLTPERQKEVREVAPVFLQTYFNCPEVNEGAVQQIATAVNVEPSVIQTIIELNTTRKVLKAPYQPSQFEHFVLLAKNMEALSTLDKLKPYGYQFEIENMALLIEIHANIEHILSEIQKIRKYFPLFEYRPKENGSPNPYDVLYSAENQSGKIWDFLYQGLEDTDFFSKLCHVAYYACGNPPDKTEEGKRRFTATLRSLVPEICSKKGKYFSKREWFNNSLLWTVLSFCPQEIELILSLSEYDAYCKSAKEPVNICAKILLLIQKNVSQPGATAKKIMEECGKKVDVSRLWETAEWFMGSLGGEFDVDLFISYVKEIGLHKAVMIFQIYQKIKKLPQPDDDLKSKGITAVGAVGVQQLKKQLHDFYVRLIQQGKTPQNFLANPLQIDMLRVLSNFDGSKWKKRDVDFKDLVERFLEDESNGRIAVLPEYFYETTRQGEKKLRSGKIQAHGIASGFVFSPDAKHFYTTAISEIKQALEWFQLSQEEREKVVPAELVKAINLEEDHVEKEQLSEKNLGNPKALEGLKRKKEKLKEKLRNLRIQISQGENPILVLAQHDPNGETTFAPFVRTLLFLEGLKVNATYLEEFKEKFRTGQMTEISIPNITMILEFARDIIKNHALPELKLGPKDEKTLRGFLKMKALAEDLSRAQKTKGEGKITLLVVPARGVLGELSGYFSDACWTRRADIMEQNPNMMAFYFVENPEDPDAMQIVGGSLLIVTQSGGTETFVIRGFNPQDKIVNRFKADELVESFIRYLEKIPLGRGNSKRFICYPGNSGARSNRPSVNQAFSQLGGDKISLDDHVTFNDYDITSDCYRIKTVIPKATQPSFPLHADFPCDAAI